MQQLKKLFLLCMAFAAMAVQAVPISGTVTNNQGALICGLVLANGQFVFSCSPNGSYSLDAPLDSAGQITIFAFADGHFPFKRVVTAGGRYDLQLTFATSAAPTNANRDKTALLLGGTWTYTYTIISTYSDRYTFTTMISSPDSNGDYFASGTDPFGGLVVGGYVSSVGQYGVLSKGTIIDQFYTFTLSGNNNASGCYYLISPPGSTNLSRCYAMSGFRSPPKADALPRNNEERLLREMMEDSVAGPPEPGAVETYLRLREQLGR